VTDLAIPDNLRPQDARLLAGLAAGLSIKAAAESAGMSESTAHRRLRDPGFARELSELCMSIIAPVVAKALSLAPLAFDAYEKKLRQADPDVRAARDVVEGVYKLLPLLAVRGMDERLRAVEAALKQREQL